MYFLKHEPIHEYEPDMLNKNELFNNGKINLMLSTSIKFKTSKCYRLRYFNSYLLLNKNVSLGHKNKSAQYGRAFQIVYMSSVHE